MIEQTSIEHHIQKYIISVLMYQKFARFRDMRPPHTDTNLYSYHLKLLLKNNYVRKTSDGYILGKNGVLYVDRVSTSTLKVRTQPKIIVMLVVQNHDGDLLLYHRERQPFAHQWTLPYGKLHLDDETLLAAAHREAQEKLRHDNQTIRHSGDCYIRIKDQNETIMSTLAHIFRMEVDELVLDKRQKWVRPHKLANYDLAPAVEKIVARSFFNDPYFFEEFEEAW